MAHTLDLRHIPRTDEGKIAVGEGGPHAASYDDHAYVALRDAVLAPVDVKRDIHAFVLQAGRLVSRAEICKGIGRKKAAWINVHIQALVEAGWLKQLSGSAKNGVVMYWYEAARP